MTKYLLITTSVAALALALAPPSFAGDDSATIVQSGGSGNLAQQHQPGVLGNSAYINQLNDTSNVATQEQWHGLNSIDFAINGKQTIYQTGNYKAKASQTDNGSGDVQTATQTGNTVSGATLTSVTQTINSPLGYYNHQTSTQTSNYGSSVDQNMGGSAPGSYKLHDNTQTANQSGQTLSKINQSINGTSDHNNQSASETGYGTGNSISQTILASYQDKQTASIHNGSYNVVDQLQASGSHNNIQTVTVDTSNYGRALQYQGVNVSGGQETIGQTGGGDHNQAGQAQGDSGNIAVVSQIGGSNNTAIQNQGVFSGHTGFMHVVGGVVTRTP